MPDRISKFLFMMEIGMYVRFDRWFMMLILVTGALACQSISPTAAEVNESSAAAELSTSIAADGSIVLVTVRAPAGMKLDEEALKGEFADFHFPFYRAGEGLFEAVLGIPYSYKPGTAEVRVLISAADGREAMRLALPLTIIDGNYDAEKLRVSPKHLNPSPKDMIRIRRDQKEVGAIYRNISRTKLWDGPFRFPMNSAITSVYGTKRVFNGQLASYHSGLDLRAAVGSRVHAPAKGKVVLAKDLFFSGKTVMLDHGYGVVTFYAHLSRMRVKKGQMVEVGQLLGLSGATGRVSGPHLHWSAVIQKNKVNPMDLIKVLK